MFTMCTCMASQMGVFCKILSHHRKTLLFHFETQLFYIGTVVYPVKQCFTREKKTEYKCLYVSIEYAILPQYK